MSMEQHTPGPWQLVESLGDEAYINVKGGWPLTFGDGSFIKADAAHIVHCVNMHDELLAVLRDALPYVDRHESENFSNIALDISTRGHALLARAGVTQ